MKRLFFPLLLVCLWQQALLAQSGSYTAANIHAHNDYERPVPFYNAFALHAGSIEADVFLKGKHLYVAHTAAEIKPAETLDALYLAPLQAAIQKNGGKVYPDGEGPLQLMIDLKTEGPATLHALVKKLKRYPEITKNSGVKVVVSGSMPPVSTWPEYPSYIYFDGRPDQTYTPEQLKRVAMISDDFKKYSQWNGKGRMVQAELEQVQAMISKVHQQQKKVRFWGAPEGVNAWKGLMHLGVDYLGSDDVGAMAKFFQNLPNTEYTNTASHTLYKPKYKNNDQRTKVKNVILLIGDGMGLAQLYAGYTAAAGRLNLFNMLNIGISKTAASDTYITDSAAGATAMATGKKTNNRHVGVDSAGHPLTPLPELLSSVGMESALISSGDITDATPAAFYSHQTERSMSEAIAADFLQSSVNILIGGNARVFTERADAQDLFKALQQKGYVTADKFSALDTITSNKFVVLDSEAVVPKSRGRGDFLSHSLNKAITALAPKPTGFFIMAEGAQIDWGGHANKMDYVVQEMLDFDRMVGEAMKFADENGETLVIVTADHETGGLSLLDGDQQKGYVAGNFSTGDHTAIPVPVFSYGPHSLDFRGVYENTEIFHKIMKIVQQYHAEKQAATAQ